MCPGTINKSLSQNQAFLKNGPGPQNQAFSEQKLVRGSGHNGEVLGLASEESWVLTLLWVSCTSVHSQSVGKD